MSPAVRNISGSSKYLQLQGISLAPSNISGFFKCLQLWRMSPAPSNVSGCEEYVQLPQISLWLRRISPALDYFRLHFFLVERWFKRSCPSRGLFCRSLTQRCYHERPELLVKGSFITEGRMTDAWSLSTLTRGCLLITWPNSIVITV